MSVRSGAKMLALFACLGVLGALQATVASAHEGEYARFNYCPSTTEGVFKCIISTTEGGEVVLGNKKVPIENPVTI